MNDLTARAKTDLDLSRFEPLKTCRVVAGHAFEAQEPTLMKGIYIQHWKATTCSRTIFRLANGWWVSDEDAATRQFYPSMEKAMEAAAKAHTRDMRRARDLLSRYHA
jgi:hypothetical protein